MSDPTPTQPMATARPRLFDPFRLLFGTLTVLPVQPPRAVDRRVAGRAMSLAPLAGLVLAVIVVVPVELLWRGGESSPLLLAVLAVGGLAMLTRGIHLDGLADVADGLGSGRRGEDALAIMRKSDIGPFGVATLALVLLLQVAALADLVWSGLGAEALVIAAVASRATLPVLCGPGFRAARADGLGAVMSGSVSARQRWVSLTAAVVLVLAAYGVLALPHWVDPGRATALVIPALVGIGLGLLTAARAVRRFGGTTGDVYGAVVETTFTATLVLGALIA